MENISPENNLDSCGKKYNNCYTQEHIDSRWPVCPDSLFLAQEETLWENENRMEETLWILNL
jgi:hypothetical protein